MTIERFEDIISWQKGKDLTILIYKLLKGNRDYCYRNQIVRAVISICNNIAEGFERRRNKEFKQFLFISKGSCGEVRSLLHMGLALEYFNQKDFQAGYDLCLEV